MLCEWPAWVTGDKVLVAWLAEAGGNSPRRRCGTRCRSQSGTARPWSSRCQAAPRAGARQVRRGHRGGSRRSCRRRREVKRAEMGIPKISRAGRPAGPTLLHPTQGLSPSSDCALGAPGPGAQRAAVSWASLPMLEEHAVAKVTGCFMDKLRAHCTENGKKCPPAVQGTGCWALASCHVRLVMGSLPALAPPNPFCAHSACYALKSNTVLGLQGHGGP